ncbi:hypothetical protein RB195_016792 [Necator americanus]|uniref:Serpentine receptor class gamma n=1 Tax=Necator americanus TaxID=51031 RepID=A0ABR1C5W3_NECAM
MITERAVALWKRKRYENHGKIVGYSIAACCMITSVLLTTWTLIQMNLHMQTVYCSAGTAETAFRVRTLSFILCGIDLTTLSATAIVFILNEVAVRRKIFDLQSSYQLSENANVIRVISPLHIYHTLLHIGCANSVAVDVKVVSPEASNKVKSAIR